MKNSDDEHALAISVWESEGGAPNRSMRLYQYGRRVECDRSYTIYHVFTGVPAKIGSWTMTGLSQKNAARALRTLNTP